MGIKEAYKIIKTLCELNDTEKSCVIAEDFEEGVSEGYCNALAIIEEECPEVLDDYEK